MLKKLVYNKAAWVVVGIFIAILLLPGKCWSQNLIPNSSFEQLRTCTLYVRTLALANDWFSPNGATPDVLYQCAIKSNMSPPTTVFGFQYPLEGKSYAHMVFAKPNGIYLDGTTDDYHEGISCRLKQPLKTGHIYCGSFFLSVAEVSGEYTTDRLDINFQADNDFYPGSYRLDRMETSVSVPIHFPTDTMHWLRYTYKYQAKGGEEYFTLSQFSNSKNMVYKPTNISVGEKWDYVSYFIDSLSLYDCGPLVPNLFSPNKDGINEIFKIKKLPPHSIFSVYNRWGNQVYHADNYQNNWSGECYTMGKATPCSDGTYYYVLQTPEGFLLTGHLFLTKN